MALQQAIIESIARKEILVDDLSISDLVEFCSIANLAYRAGHTIISDDDYDFIYLAALKKSSPKHPFLHNVEPENQNFLEEKLFLPEPMLSIDKAYSWAEVNKWIERLKKAATDIDFSIKNIKIKATAKLDGFAGFDDGKYLYTRGDGKKGSDISRVFKRGLCLYNDSNRGQGAGEIVIKKSYFQTKLKDSFEHPRNFQASLIKEKQLDVKTQKAITNKAALFVPFSQLPKWLGSIGELKDNFYSVVAQIAKQIDFYVDGVVFEVVNEPIKKHMGANRKFHRWQIAFKENKDKVEVAVISITSQVGRTGKITPVAELEPTVLSGATIVRATGHNYGWVKKQELGSGSVVELTRSGMVIPKINKVLKSTKAYIPKYCPSCNSELVWDNDFLICTNNSKCPAQIIEKVAHFFKVLANNDGFGEATIKKLYEFGIHKVSQVYLLTEDALIKIGFGKKVSFNLIQQLNRSRSEQIEDWRFLAAFGMVTMGVANCENLLRHYPLEKIFNLKIDDIINIDGFAELTAKIVITGLQSIYDEFELLYNHKFNLAKTLVSKKIAQSSHALSGMQVVFSGKMIKKRDEMQKHAKSIGIKVATSINSKTDLLIAGDGVGEGKINKAKALSIAIISEAEYLYKIKLFKQNS